MFTVSQVQRCPKGGRIQPEPFPPRKMGEGEKQQDTYIIWGINRNEPFFAVLINVIINPRLATGKLHSVNGLITSPQALFQNCPMGQLVSHL